MGANRVTPRTTDVHYRTYHVQSFTALPFDTAGMHDLSIYEYKA